MIAVRDCNCDVSTAAEDADDMSPRCWCFGILHKGLVASQPNVWGSGILPRDAGPPHPHPCQASGLPIADMDDDFHNITSDELATLAAAAATRS